MCLNESLIHKITIYHLWNTNYTLSFSLFNANEKWQIMNEMALSKFLVKYHDNKLSAYLASIHKPRWTKQSSSTSTSSSENYENSRRNGAFHFSSEYRKWTNSLWGFQAPIKVFLSILFIDLCFQIGDCIEAQSGQNTSILLA